MATPGTMQQTINEQSYEDWFESVFKQRVPVPGARLAASWDENSYWGRKVHSALVEVECEYVRMLLGEVQQKEIEGDIAEFGIFQGWWINYFWRETEKIGLRRRIYGFDSFEGLSKPDAERDGACWKEGMYACSLEQVTKNVEAHERPRIKLVKGFFERSLREPDALLAEEFCFARIDCDLYEPARDCLNYLTTRLADGAILVFDDWPHMLGIGEQLAFSEWVPRVPKLEFEFLFYNTIGHFYLRVHHKK